MKGKTAAIALSLSLGSILPANAESLCKAYTVDRPGGAYDYAEVNNCPILNGNFSSSTRTVKLAQWEPAAYLFEQRNLETGKMVNIIDFNVAGTTTRPQYRFEQDGRTYVVSFQTADIDTIRLEIFQRGERVLNQLLSRYVP